MTDGLLLDATFVHEQLARLHAAFPRSTKAQDPSRVGMVWREGLSGLDREAVHGAVSKIVRDDEHFPRIARVREMAREWIKRNRVELVRQHPDGDLVCPSCGYAAGWQQRWRLKTTSVIGDVSRFVVVPEGDAVELETYERLLCRCATKQAYEIEEREPPCVLIVKLTQYDQSRLAAQQRRVPRERTGTPTWAKAGVAVGESSKPAPALPALPAGEIAEVLVEKAVETGRLPPIEKRREREPAPF